MQYVLTFLVQHTWGQNHSLMKNNYSLEDAIKHHYIRSQSENVLSSSNFIRQSFRQWHPVFNSSCVSALVDAMLYHCTLSAI